MIARNFVRQAEPFKTALPNIGTPSEEAASETKPRIVYVCVLFFSEGFHFQL